MSKEICNCVQATSLLNKIIALLECELTKNDIPKIIELIFEYISVSQHGFYVFDLVNIMRLLEISCNRIPEVPAFKEVLHHVLNICKIPPFLKVCSDVLTYTTDITEYFAVLGYLLILVEDIGLQEKIIETIRSLLVIPAKFKNQLSLKIRRKEASSGRFPGLLGQALFLINDELFFNLLQLTFKFIVDSPNACKDLATNDALNSLFSRMDGTWRSRFPNTHPNITEDPAIQHLNIIVVIANVILVHLKEHKEYLPEVPVITRFSLWNIKYIFHYVTIISPWEQVRNNLITIIICIMALFPKMDFVPSGLGEALLVDGFTMLQNIYMLMWNKSNDSEESFYFIKMFLFCLPLYIDFPHGKSIIEKFRGINKVLRLISLHGKKKPPIEHACVIKILSFKVFNKVVPCLEEDFIENSGPVILLNVLKNINTSTTGLTVAVHCLDTIRCVLKHDNNKFVSHSVLFNNGFNILLDVCKDIMAYPQLEENAQMCLQEIFSIFTSLFDHITDLMLFTNLPELVNIPVALFNRFLHPQAEEPTYDNRIIINVMCFIWKVVIKFEKLCEIFYQNDGIYILLDILQVFPLPVQMVTLATLVDICEYSEGKCIPYLITWTGKNKVKLIPLLMDIFRNENKILEVKTGLHGEILDGDHPLMGTEQYKEVFEKKNFKICPTVIDMCASCRPKIYALLTLVHDRYASVLEIANETYKTFNEPLSAQDKMSLLLAENYFGLKFGEAWEEVKYEFDELGFKPLPTDNNIICSLVERTHNWGQVLKVVQEELLEIEKVQNIKREDDIYNELRNGRISAALESINEAKYIARCTERMFRISQKFSQINQVEKSMAKIEHGQSVHKTFMSTIPITLLTLLNSLLNDVF